jgi:hypothetical protein
MAQLYLGDEELVAKRAAASYSLYIYARESIHITLGIVECVSSVTIMMP